ncbi:MAG: hypothetical protein IPK50_19760 [Fibrobacterota bacterium]|nr:MAG: hypothetical protein IPK50_19760 [Fibrobacterota bacterium]
MPADTKVSWKTLEEQQVPSIHRCQKMTNRCVVLCILLALSSAKFALGADWVLDRCQFTYKGTPVPLGMGLPEFTKLFGPPSDSLITPWQGHGPVKTYFWDKLGLRTRMRSDAHPDLFGGVEINFREPVVRFPRKHRHTAHGTSTMEFKPFGLVNATSIQTIIAEGFLPGHPRNAREDDYLELELGNRSRLTLLFVKDDSARHSNVSVRYAAPDDTKFPNYADAMAKMGANCKLP